MGSKKYLYYVGAAALFLTACAMRAPVTQSADLQKKIKSQEHELQFLRDENRILKQKIAEQLQVATPAPEPARPIVDAPVPESVPDPASPASGDKMLYAKVIESYRAGHMDELIQATDLLERGYPESEHVDNAIYLKGLYFFAHDRPVDALRAFKVIREKYAQGNKVPSALFAEAMAFKKLHRISEARQKLKSVAQLYPGSPESGRVELELRLLEQ